jgi:Xaa-Pro aminopeptidase
MSELESKLNTIQGLLKKHGLDALLLNRASSFAWATCGASSYINTASSDGLGSLLITPEGRFLITTNIEAPRLEKEQGLAAQGWESKIGPWYEGSNPVGDLTRGMKLGADRPVSGAVDLSGEVSRLRAALLPEEVERFRSLGRRCAEAMDSAIRAVRPGMTEHEIAAKMAFEAEKREAQAIVNLIATDERIYNFRHPLPAPKKMERYAMIVLCGRWKGLVCSITRLVYFGRLPEDLRRKMAATAQVDATFLAATRPGAKLSDVFQRAVNAYAETGFAGEWRLHHQGGPAGYEPREFIATPSVTDQVIAGQVYAWNPSITGTKSEDSILVGQNENEVLSTIAGWPEIQVTVDGKSFSRPAILEIL